MGIKILINIKYYRRLFSIKRGLDDFLLEKESARVKSMPILNSMVDSMALSDSLDEMLENKAETFSSMLLRLIDEKALKDSVVYKKANIDRRLFSKIRGDEDYVPSKKTAISFCIALELDLDESKELLNSAGYSLSEASKLDLIMSYLINKKEYDIRFVNIVLDEYGVGTLSR